MFQEDILLDQTSKFSFEMVLTQTMEGGKMVLILYSFLPEGNFGLLEVFTHCDVDLK